MDLGKLTKFNDLRSVWKNEAYDFTKWLSKEENLELLSNEIGIDIELIETEAKTGSFSADILAIESNTDNKIIIENQLENTNHDHLGKIITYASGHNAQTIIWIVKDVREEHRQAIDWLNEHTDEEINIFLCRIELWKIDDSKIAPKFQIISSPNNWTKVMKKITGDNNISNTKLLQLDYFTELKSYFNNKSDILKPQKPLPHNYTDLRIGTNLAHIVLKINTQTPEIKIELWIRNNKNLFNYLHNMKDIIEEELGFSLIWSCEKNRKSSNISSIKNIDINNKNNWDEAIKWHFDLTYKFYNVFSKYLEDFKN